MTDVSVPAFSPGWSRTSGSLQMPTWDQKAGGGASDRDLVLEVVYLYALGMDERDETLLREVFHADVQWHGVIAGTTRLEYDGIDATIQFLNDAAAAQTDQRRHCALNPIVRFSDENTARVTTHLMIHSADPSREGVIVSAGFYQVVVTRREGEWRIADFMAGFDTPF